MTPYLNDPATHSEVAIPEELRHLPVAVIGAGPVGLAAAARLAERHMPFVVFEAGVHAGANVRDWGHVQLFSPWSELVDPAAQRLLTSSGWSRPAESEPLPTGSELIDRYLAPLAAHPAIAPHVRYGSTVVAVHRRNHDKVKTDGRASDPFVLRVRSDDEETSFQAAAVLDASGTWNNPNPAGAGGVAAFGEEHAAHRVAYRIPDVLGVDAPDYVGRHVLVVGAGHSAVNAILDLVSLSERDAATKVTWAVRRSAPDRVFGSETPDRLPARESLGRRMADAVQRGAVEVVTNFSVDSMAVMGDQVTVRSTGADEVVADRVIVLTGQRPDLSITRELRLDLDPWLEAPRRLAPLIDPNVHTCGTVERHGYETLRHPEPGYFILGVKSYGRAPTFLMSTGYEQVRSVVAALDDDLDAARTPSTQTVTAADGRPQTAPSAPPQLCCA